MQVYYLLYKFVRDLQDVPQTTENLAVKHKIFSYFSVFLYLHIYIFSALIVYTYSLFIIWMVPLAGIIIVLDCWMLIRYFGCGCVRLVIPESVLGLC